MTLLISPHELAERLRTGKRTTLLASFWKPGEDQGRRAFHSEHIPTSVFCDPVYALAGTPSRTLGRNPLPDASQLKVWFQSWGITPDSHVVVYDYGDEIYAARAWWILTWAGIPNVRILDGGMKAWEAAGYPVIAGPGNLPIASTVEPTLGHLPVASYEDVVRAYKTGDATLIDCRSANRFAGFKESLDLKAGHIPGSVNVSTRDMIHRDRCGEFRSKEEILELFARAGIHSGKNTIMISGSGVHSALAIAAMHYVGLEGCALFPGGWSQWCADPTNPVEHGLGTPRS